MTRDQELELKLKLDQIRSMLAREQELIAQIIDVIEENYYVQAD